MNLTTLLQRLDAEMATLAGEALSQPAARDSFEYGRVVGLYGGLKRAKELLIDTVRDAEEKSYNL